MQELTVRGEDFQRAVAGVGDNDLSIVAHVGIDYTMKRYSTVHEHTIGAPSCINRGIGEVGPGSRASTVEKKIMAKEIVLQSPGLRRSGLSGEAI